MESPWVPGPEIPQYTKPLKSKVTRFVIVCVLCFGIVYMLVEVITALWN